MSISQFFSLSAAFVIAVPAFASGPLVERDRDELKSFSRDPRAFLNALPPKILGDGNPLDESFSLFSSSVTLSGTYLKVKAGPSGNGPYPGTDRAQDLVDQMSVWTLEEMENAGLRSAMLAESPWSGSYWPLYAGELGARYADPAFPNSLDWKTNQKYVIVHLGEGPIDQLSPAEKYDLLVGDPSHSLTHASLEDGERYFDQSGAVETWMGICHGWSPASFMEARPRHTVSVSSADGTTQIGFRPTDIKALASLLWANGVYSIRFIGSRCDKVNPPRDATGRVIDPTCYGENPATWHLAVVNQLGASRRSFVMDASSDYQVWNQPVLGYAYSYFNPQTLQPVGTLAAAKVTRAEFTGDRFAAYRAPNAATFVGVSMDLTYIAETHPTTAATDSPDADSRVTVHYLYDLELDASNRLIGGEWYRNAHPGFLWSVARGTHSLAKGDAGISSDLGVLWNGQEPIPGSWLTPASKASELGQPLAHVVEALVSLAQ